LQVLRAADQSGTRSERLVARLDALPDSQLASRPAADLAAALGRWSKLQDGAADAAARYRDQTKTIEFTVAVDRGVGSGAFAKLAGTLSGQGLQILSADLCGQPDGLLVIGFETTDTHGSGRPDEERVECICRELRDAVHRDGPPKLRRLWNDAIASRQAALSALAHRVEFENASSRHTILEVYTFDRRGLLYAIAQRIHDLGLTIHAARIATYLDQVVDVFYVTDRRGHKVTDDERLANIRSSLLEVVSQVPEE
jgi:[protein-PII] uridylyltransferase